MVKKMAVKKRRQEVRACGNIVLINITGAGCESIVGIQAYIDDKNMLVHDTSGKKNTVTVK